MVIGKIIIPMAIYYIKEIMSMEKETVIGKNIIPMGT